MQINNMKVFVVGNPPPHHGGRYFIFLKLFTDNGIEGVGEVYCATFHPLVVEKMIIDVFERHIEGMNPFRIESLWRSVYGRGSTLRPDDSLMGAISGIEIAMWDILGKADEKKISEIL